MNWQKLQRGAVREFKRSPGKTALLLALLPVAAYFIGPLLLKKSPGSRSLGTAPAAAAPPTADSPAVAGPPPAVWRDLARWMAEDSRMRAAPCRGLRNPFEAASGARAEADADENERAAGNGELEPSPTPPVVDRGPRELGLQLTSTIVGSRVRMATINGRPYREQAQIPILHVGEDDVLPAAAEAPFLLKRVNRKSVVLERNGKLYQLDLAR